MRSFSLLKKLDVPDIATYATIFLLLFSIGILGGKSLGKITLFQRLTKKNYSDDIPAMIKNGQHNLLVVEVDSLSSPEPKLKSVWLLISLLETNNLTLIPLYPRIKSGVIFIDPSLSQAFRLTPQGYPGPIFLKQLGQKIWWDNYLLIDEVGVTKVLETLKYQEKDNLNLNTSNTYEAIPPVWLDPETALQGQVALLKETCAHIDKRPGFSNINSILQQANAHILTDLDQSGKPHQDKFDHQEIQSLTCEFPTLTFDTP
jgi:hypothetical protein